VLQTKCALDSVSFIVLFLKLKSISDNIFREDDQKLLALVKQFKSNHDLWAIINEYFPERDRQQLKGRLKRLTNEAAGVMIFTSNIYSKNIIDINISYILKHQISN